MAKPNGAMKQAARSSNTRSEPRQCSKFEESNISKKADDFEQHLQISEKADDFEQDEISDDFEHKISEGDDFEQHKISEKGDDFEQKCDDFEQYQISEKADDFEQNEISDDFEHKISEKRDDFEHKISEKRDDFDQRSISEKDDDFEQYLISEQCKFSEKDDDYTPSIYKGVDFEYKISDLQDCNLEPDPEPDFDCYNDDRVATGGKRTACCNEISPWIVFTAAMAFEASKPLLSAGAGPSPKRPRYNDEGFLLKAR
jgi:hypothetical protein